MNDKEIIEDYNSGLGISTLVKNYNVSQNKIHQILNSNNVPIRSKGGRKTFLTNSQITEMISLYNKGFSLSKLESEFKVSKERIKTILRDNNIIVREYNTYKNIPVGSKFNRLTFIEELKERKNNKIQWLVQCKCGNQKIVMKPDVLSNKTKSCGCLKNEGRLVYDDRVELVMRNLFTEYKNSARKRFYLFELDFIEFKQIINKNCYYCNSPHSSIRTDEKTGVKVSYMGIDRKNNSEGYSLDNTVPCCITCNIMKKTWI
ncbi:hypothetical protein AAHH67_15340 [Niallia circulans]